MASGHGHFKKDLRLEKKACRGDNTPEGEDMGFAFQQDANGKIWYTLVVGGGPVLSVLSPAPRANTAPPAPAPTVPVPTTETPGV